MRWLLSTGLILLAGPALAQQDDAEKLYRAMESKVLTAKSAKILCDVEMMELAKSAKYKGIASYAEENKARVEFGGKDMSILLVSDSAKTFVRISGAPPFVPRSTFKDLNTAFAGILARGGFLFGATMGAKYSEGDKLDLDKKLTLSDFTLAPKERVGSVEANVIQYIVALDGDKNEKIHIKLWLDPDSLLPLKRMLIPDEKGGPSMREVYTEFTLDAKLDPKLFELPKYQGTRPPRKQDTHLKPLLAHRALERLKQ